QLLSDFARALDDTSALVVQDFNSRNPMYASGSALDLLLPQYGLVRAEGETDASVRSRIRHALAARSTNSYDALLAAVMNAKSIEDAKLYVNDTDATDARGIPAHNIAVVTKYGTTKSVAQAIFDHKPPGIATYGSTTGTAKDAAGNSYAIHFTRYTDRPVFIYPFISALPGGSQAAIEAAVVPAIRGFVGKLGIGEALIIPQLYGVIYGADPALASTFVVTDIQVAEPGGSSVVRSRIEANWDEIIVAPPTGGVSIRWANS
ncbi:MAG: hypothetical protein IJI09_07530, partial [Clostridia bacterium]|nr:hypothetical protein [Clostridia bacterium]